VSPEQVVQADLSFLKMPNARKNTLKAFAQFMLKKPQADVDEWLKIKGIGVWTVNYVTMRNSESPDIFLATDLVIKNQIKKLAEQEVNIIQEAAAPWRSYLTLSLWNLSSGTLNTKIDKVS
jgi:AraC family transcriptional regulator of adaptative response / DNA-3-methyladenine glycosylase II